MEATSLEQWKRWRNEGKYTTLPLLSKRSWTFGEASPAAGWTWTKAWQAASPYAIVLESGKDGRYTYLAIRPSAVIRGKGEAAEEIDLSTGKRTAYNGKPLDVVRRWMAAYTGPRLEAGPNWTGGCAGFWGYDVVRSIERLPVLAHDDLDLPDYLFMRVDELWIVDHREREVICAVHTHVNRAVGDAELEAFHRAALRKTEKMWDLWRTIVSPDGADRKLAERRGRYVAEQSPHIDIESLPGLSSPFSKERFMEAVRAIQRYIGQGDVFQVNLSLRQERPVDASPEELYEWLRLLNPSPYMGFLRCPDFQLVSASPELLVQLKDGTLSTRPIAGTRRRGRTPEEDERMAEELRTNEKERAEHIMLVDLERNDLGRISAYGTVQVKELMVIERYSHVMHLVSQVEGKLADGKDAFDVVAATFPGGTITGAPKIRTMEIIEELEPVRRGPYTGSLGWIDYSGDLEFNIIIRTMTVRNGVVYIQAGAGIVIDSDPEREYRESLNKAKALWKAIDLCERFAGTAGTALAADRRKMDIADE
ncbi:anthranilate synthase [Paenibacillus sp. 32O-W]|uniref:anthranilate synthase component I family protein n=1 Tax=Paenibacillus sp. 32O-W TaxID=1695218 RepID=UPI000720F9B2|nr:anthranilate synthase component I family protein [Paenibacillus sp. 32O-W]ALS25720.1 anthranilate synthase [Paenibacillus sp. 32O-W]